MKRLLSDCLMLTFFALVAYMVGSCAGWGIEAEPPGPSPPVQMRAGRLPRPVHASERQR